MADDLNRVTMVGRITRDAELQYTKSGTAMCSFAIASNSREKRGDQWVDEVSFFDLNLWGKTAEALSKYLLKGGMVAVDGKIKQNRWEKDGQKQTKLQIHVEKIQLLTKSSGSGASESRPAPEQHSGEVDHSAFEDDIPF